MLAVPTALDAEQVEQRKGSAFCLLLPRCHVSYFVSLDKICESSLRLVILGHGLSDLRNILGSSLQEGRRDPDVLAELFCRRTS